MSKFKLHNNKEDDADYAIIVNIIVEEERVLVMFIIFINQVCHLFNNKNLKLDDGTSITHIIPNDYLMNLLKKKIIVLKR